MLNIKTWRDPYDAGFSPTRPKEIEFKPGITVLVGCNGAGKSTLINNIKEQCKSKNIPYISYDNLTDGGNNSMSMYLSGFGDRDDLSKGIALYMASEGEAIKFNTFNRSEFYKEFFDSGIFNDRPYKMLRIFGVKEQDYSQENRRVLLFDGVDSGLSVDSVIELKDHFDDILHYAKEKTNAEVYIIIAANEYELAKGSDCFDVNAGKYLTFDDYEDYRSFILKSREKKERRLIKQEEFFEKKEARLKAKKMEYESRIAAIKEKAELEERELTWEEKHKIDNLEWDIRRLNYD